MDKLKMKKLALFILCLITVGIALAFPVDPNEPGLVALYKMDEASGASTIADSSGNVHTGTVVGATSGVVGIFGSALSFDDVDDKVIISSLTGSPFSGSEKFTVKAWINLGTSTVELPSEMILSKHHSSSATGFFEFELNINRNSAGSGNHRLMAVVDASSIPGTTIEGGTNVQEGVWTHVALTYDGSTGTMNLYQNGVLQNSGTVPSGVQTSSSAAEPLQIGRQKANDHYYFPGKIDDVAIFNRVLNDAEIAENAETGEVPPPPQAPEFSAYGIIFAIVAIGLVSVYLVGRKKK